MCTTKFIFIAVILLMVEKGGAWTPDRDTDDQNFTHEVVLTGRSYGRPSLQNFNRDRQSALLYEESRYVGADLVLSSDELRANQIIMRAKTDEYESGILSPRRFAPAKHLFDVLNQIRSSKLFKIISAMPKGGVLHTHSTAMGNTEVLIELTRRDHLWACVGYGGLQIFGFEFSKGTPLRQLKQQCSWKSMADLKSSKGRDTVENYLRDRLSLHPKTTYADNNEVWNDFENIFDLLGGLLHFAPARKDYFYKALEEFNRDGVHYVEIRTSLSILYDLEGTDFKAEDTVRMYEETVKEFKEQNPHFWGCKLIISPYRGKSDKKLDNLIQTFYDIQKKFPDFVVGFDLVGQEEKGRPLKDMASKLLDMRQRGVQFYFHAGETNWFGSTVDENLIDAVMLETKRIGHGYAVPKHPAVMQSLKDKGIAVEVNPVSNQVLQLVKDLRNHPAAYLFSNNFPVVVSSDDPSFWKSTPLSHDFYVAFLGIASAHADLKFLKKLALNSIQYSAMTEKQKSDALLWFNTKWYDFIRDVNRQYK